MTARRHGHGETAMTTRRLNMGELADAITGVPASRQKSRQAGPDVPLI
jgi:hypothetical protein